MARNRRIWNPAFFDHVVTRGNNRQDLFKDSTDINAFFRILDYTYERHPFTILAYCIMTNHYHLLIRSPEVPLGNVMAIINKRYSEYHKKRYNYSGALYESRYFAEMAVTPKSLLAVSRYIHRNPIETTIPMVDKMELYPYSSYSFYVQGKTPQYEFLDFGQLPLLLPAPYSKTAQDYLRYCEKEDYESLD